MNFKGLLLVASILLAVAAAAVLFGWFGIDASHFTDGLGLGFLGLAALAGAELL